MKRICRLSVDGEVEHLFWRVQNIYTHNNRPGTDFLSLFHVDFLTPL